MRGVGHWSLPGEVGTRTRGVGHGEPVVAYQMLAKSTTAAVGTYPIVDDDFQVGEFTLAFYFTVDFMGAHNFKVDDSNYGFHRGKYTFKYTFKGEGTHIDKYAFMGDCVHELAIGGTLPTEFGVFHTSYHMQLIHIRRLEKP